MLVVGLKLFLFEKTLYLTKTFGGGTKILSDLIKNFIVDQRFWCRHEILCGLVKEKVCSLPRSAYCFIAF